MKHIIHGAASYEFKVKINLCIQCRNPKSQEINNILLKKRNKRNYFLCHPMNYDRGDMSM